LFRCDSYFTLQGRCKPKAESSLFAEVQPVLATFMVQRYEESATYPNLL